MEEYAIDTLRTYAPVDGLEITCSPLVWNANNVFDDLQDAIETNTIALRTTGSAENYFKIDKSVVSMGPSSNIVGTRSFPLPPACPAKSIPDRSGPGSYGVCVHSVHTAVDENGSHFRTLPLWSTL